MLSDPDKYYMQLALKEAQKAYDEEEIPVGAIVVCKDRIIGKGYNQTEKLRDVTAHAEMLAITAAQNFLGAKFLEECTLYVTLEPCLMCAGAIYWARPARLVIGARDEKRGYLNLEKPVLHPETLLSHGVMEAESSEMLKTFFRKLR